MVSSSLIVSQCGNDSSDNIRNTFIVALILNIIGGNITLLICTAFFLNGLDAGPGPLAQAFGLILVVTVVVSFIVTMYDVCAARNPGSSAGVAPVGEIAVASAHPVGEMAVASAHSVGEMAVVSAHSVGEMAVASAHPVVAVAYIPTEFSSL